MRTSIRDQILIPLIIIQGAATCVTALATASLAAWRGERQVIDRLNGVIAAVGRSSFPYTDNVLALMRDLSGAEFLAYGPDGRIAARSAPGLAGVAPLTGYHRGRDGPARLDALGDSPTVSVAGVRYLAVSIAESGRPRAPALLVLYPETSWRRARHEAATPPLVLGGVALALMVAVTGWIAHRLGERIRDVNRRVARIADGDLAGIDPGPARDEIAELVGSINAMCLRLKDMSRTIQQSERARVLAQLAAGLAHQLRNSLTGARLSVQLHARRHPAPAGDRSLEVALRQLAMTEEQVRGLLALGRVEDRPPRPTDLRRLLGEVALLVGPACEHARVRLEGPGDPGPLEAIADEAGLRAAALNLVVNAIEAAGGGGTVWLGAVAEGGSVAIEVEDTGPGPPPSIADSLYEPFTTSKPEGVGLGLALAHDVALRHGGRLAWTRAAGKTRFRLEFPRVRIDTEERG